MEQQKTFTKTGIPALVRTRHKATGKSISRRLVRHHLPLGLASGVLVVLLYSFQPLADAGTRISVATAYIGLLWLCVTLLLGPINLVRGRPNPVSTYVRRDIGLWAAMVSALHATLGLLVSVFTWSIPLAGWAMLLIILLVMLSNDSVLRRLKAKRWKRLQRLNYVVFVLAVVHTFAYQAVDQRTLPYTLMTGLAVVVVVVLQLRGWWTLRQHQKITAASGGDR